MCLQPFALMTTLRDVFCLATGGDSNVLLSSSGPSHVAELFSKTGTVVSTETLAPVYSQEQGNEARSFTWQEFRDLAAKRGCHHEVQHENLCDAAVSGIVTLPSAEEPSSARDSSDESLSLEDRIAQRVINGEFPHAAVQELANPESEKFATHVLLLVRANDIVQLKPFLEHKYSQFRSSCPDALKSSDKQCRMVYSNELYYVHIHEFLCSESLRARTFRHCFLDSRFVSLVPPPVLKKPTAQLEAVAQLNHVVAVVSTSHGSNGPFEFCTRFDAALWNTWKVCESIAKFAAQPLEEVFRAFLLGEYFAIMADVISEMQQADARAKVQPQDGCDDPMEIGSRQAMLKMMTPSMFATVEIEVRQLWQANRQDQSSVVQALLPVEPPQEFWVQHYYQVAMTIVTSIPSEGSTLCSSPPITSAGSTAAGSDMAPTGAAHDRIEVADSRSEQSRSSILIGMQAVMDDTAFEQHEPVHVKEPDHGVVGC